MRLLLILIFLVAPASASAPFFWQPVELEVQNMFYACDPCRRDYKVLKCYSKGGHRLVGNDVFILFGGKHLRETDFSAPDPQHSTYRVVGIVRWLGHTVIATTVQRLWKEKAKAKARSKKK